MTHLKRKEMFLIYYKYKSFLNCKDSPTIAFTVVDYLSLLI